MEVRFSPETVLEMEPQVKTLVGGGELYVSNHRKFVHLLADRLGENVRTAEEIAEHGQDMEHKLLHLERRGVGVNLDYLKGEKRTVASIQIEKYFADIYEVISSFDRSTKVSYSLYANSFVQGALDTPTDEPVILRPSIRTTARVSVGETTPSSIRLQNPRFHQGVWNMIRLSVGLPPRVF